MSVVLITGASSGIGYAAALAFVRAGYDVVGVARREDRLNALQAIVAAMPPPHGRFLPLVADVSQREQVNAAVAQTLETFGRVGVCIVNAGVGQRGAVVDAAWDDLETLLRLNIDGALHTLRAVIPTMRTQGSGHIITISSILAPMASPYAASYAASKAFLSSIVRSMRIELEPDHIRISDFLVGRTDTEFNEKRLGEGKRSASRLPTMTPEVVADALVRCVRQPRDVVVLRWFDRLLLWGNHWLPGLFARLTARQYR